MPDERTYGFNVDDATALLQSIETRETLYAESGAPKQRHVQCKLNTDLLAAVDSWTDPSTATAHVYRKYNGLDDMKWSGDTITIVNRFENISVDAGTYCKAEWIDGEWQLYAADCPASFSQSSLTVSVDPSASVSTGGP